MARRNQYSVKCFVCGKAEEFLDIRAIGQAYWTILCWDVASNTPTCVCKDCEYNPNGNNSKKKND
jgi:RNase P/RNase MRP subunit p30